MTETLHDLQAPEGLPQRLDKFLAEALPQHSRARLQALIKDGQVRVAGQAVRKSSHTLEGGEQVQVSVPAAQPTELVPEAIPLDIIYEDKQVIIVNKPAGLVVHPAVGHSTGTLVHAVLAHAPEIEGVGGELRPGLVHRLDKDTSGLIVLAKNERAQRQLQEQFQERTVSKTYLALTDGHPRSATGRIEAPIGRDPQQRKRMAARAPGKGREAISEYRTLETFAEHSLLEVDLHTGRTHQIRVHLAFIGCPVAGDQVYGRRKASLALGRHFLHAARLALTLPGQRSPQTFEAPLPPELQAVLDDLRHKQAKTSLQ